MRRITLTGPRRIVEVSVESGQSEKKLLDSFVSWLDEYKRYTKKEETFYYFPNDSIIQACSLKAMRMGLRTQKEFRF